MTPGGKNFDREMGLRELLTGIGLSRLQADLSLLLGEDFMLISAEGDVILGRESGGAKVPLCIEIEPLGFLHGPAGNDALLRGAAGMLVALLKCSRQYHMASELHLEAVHADYAALQEQHEALRESEKKYRRLAAELDERVKQQVKTIDTAQRQLYQAEKLASVGQLAAGIAHEINNPIGFVRSNLSTAGSYVGIMQGLAERIDSASPLASYWKERDLDFILEDFSGLLAESVSGIDRVARIVSDLKDFSNVDGVGRMSVNLNENIRSACNMIAGRIREGMTLQMELGVLPQFQCFPAHINQMLLNILLNAVQSIAANGTIRVQSGYADGEIVIRIADDGAGIAGEILPRIFDPFFTTNAVGAGTGLGLTVSRDIASAHGGSIRVDSTVGKGTCVGIFLPCRSDP